MMLACGMSYSHTSISEAILWSALLLAPVMVFLLLPKLLPLGRDLRWTRTRVLTPFLWVAARVSRKREEAAILLGRLRAAWLGDVKAHHGTDAASVVLESPRLLFRARLVGELARGTITAIGLVLSGALLLGDGGPALWTKLALVLSLLVSTLAAGWIARVAGDAAATWAQGLAIKHGWGGFARLVGGLGIGAVYGAAAGWVASFAVVWIVVPIMTLATFDAPRSVETMYAMTIGGFLGAMAGAVVGAFLVGCVALAARRDESTGGGCGCGSGGGACSL